VLSNQKCSIHFLNIEFFSVLPKKLFKIAHLITNIMIKGKNDFFLCNRRFFSVFRCYAVAFVSYRKNIDCKMRTSLTPKKRKWRNKSFIGSAPGQGFSTFIFGFLPKIWILQLGLPTSINNIKSYFIYSLEYHSKQVKSTKNTQFAFSITAHTNVANLNFPLI